MSTPSIFAETTLRDTVGRIRGLTPDAKAQWGKMNVAQMLAHCQVGIRLAVGEMTLKRAFIGYLFGKMAKKSLTSDKPWKRGLPTAKEFVVSDQRDFATERDRLLALVERLSRGGPEGLTKAPHPFFGAMTTTEWDLLMTRHLDHHLRQFGA
jgi:hypothetical protein